ncbi:RraA family protein [Kribbella sandramycini]|uniref:Putative 4-hydroxy-4-methyl-2-oxoglutarate aldolase n=1 Tax=Kribbella sandramycini TaxID=60450 RepID=A0A7Y4L2Y4_9ACTN|nr:RraA family protein [Kribbella sandramycini]MBB6564744.1 regulator of RNase E activity RraA [Kribbella sandramycini]NOL42446.1 RraA family protein [Kribbella sandramycini]
MLDRFDKLTTAHVADACLRAGLPVRTVSLTAVGGGRVAGRVLPTRHVGSVDIYLEAFESAAAGDVLVVDNGGRRDEACVGDMVALEAQQAGVSGIVIWGLHRDTADIQEIGLPVFSLGALPTGPLRLDPQPADALSSATIGEWTVTSADVVLGDEDGVLFVPADRVEELFDLAEGIRDTERAQAAEIRAGRSLRSQVKFDEFLTARAADPALTFRQHLRAVKGAVEE